jgi:hypothetical protein
MIVLDDGFGRVEQRNIRTTHRLLKSSVADKDMSQQYSEFSEEQRRKWELDLKDLDLVGRCDCWEVEEQGREEDYIFSV